MIITEMTGIYLAGAFVISGLLFFNRNRVFELPACYRFLAFANRVYDL